MERKHFKYFKYDAVRNAVRKDSGYLIADFYAKNIMSDNTTVTIEKANAGLWYTIKPGETFTIDKNANGYVLPDQYIKDHHDTTPQPKITAILAATTNNVIGSVDVSGKHSLPWKRLSPDMLRFKEITMGGIVIMGRNTFESFGSKPLPGRINIVISTTLNPLDFPGVDVIVARSIEEALDGAKHIIKQADKQEIFIIGGASIYKESLKYCDSIEYTRVDLSDKFNIENPVFFRLYDHIQHDEFVLSKDADYSEYEHKSNPGKIYYKFLTFNRK